MNDCTLPQRITVIGWTPCAESLPEEDGYYLVYDNLRPKEYPCIALYTPEIDTWEVHQLGLYTVTHWARVTPPKGES